MSIAELITALEQKFLRLFPSERFYGDGPLYFSFDALKRETGLDRETIRWMCRQLTARGLLRYERGLWSEDNCPGGAGYGLTTAGREEQTKLQEAASDPD